LSFILKVAHYPILWVISPLRFSRQREPMSRKDCMQIHLLEKMFVQVAKIQGNAK